MSLRDDIPALDIAGLGVTFTTPEGDVAAVNDFSLQLRAGDLLELQTLFLQPVPADAVRWLELGRQLRMLQSPLDVSLAMQTRVLPAEGIQAAGASACARAFSVACG